MAENADLDQQPLRDVVLCCTSLTQNDLVLLPKGAKLTARTGAVTNDFVRKTELSKVASEMGAVHKLDLTSDVTHLLVGNPDTPKYRYVAKERPDIKVLSPGFIRAVRTAWVEGGSVDVSALEQEYLFPTFLGLHLCLTGFEDIAWRKEVEKTIVAKGGIYNGDLTRNVTHLVAARPEGAKYTHAKQWGINVVSLKWYEDSLRRGMALEAGYYLPELSPEQQGVGAFRTKPKRPRPQETDPTSLPDDSGRKRLRKTASMRLGAQSQELLRDVSESEIQVETTELDAWKDESQTLRESVPVPPVQKSGPDVVPAESTDVAKQLQGLFSGYCILLSGFDAVRTTKLRRYLEQNGASIAESFDELDSSKKASLVHWQCFLVPHDQLLAVPDLPVGTLLVSEWWVERCIYYKKCLDPVRDVLSSPFANETIPEFVGLAISTTGLIGVDLRQVSEVVKMSGALYNEELAPSSAILICGTEMPKKEKAFYAKKYNIPVVLRQWLWDSLEEKRLLPKEKYLLQLPASDRGGERSSKPRLGGSDLGVSSLTKTRQSTEHASKPPGHQHPPRLSSTRQRRATPTLLLQPTVPSRAEGHRSRKCPFVYEDEADVGIEHAAVDHKPDSESCISLQHEKVDALREISPNASQQRGEIMPEEAEKAAIAQRLSDGADLERTPAGLDEPLQKGPQRSPVEEGGTEIDRTGLTSSLANLLHRSNSSNIAPLEPKRRKNRPLGRNASGVSYQSNSTTASQKQLSEAPESNSPADGFDFENPSQPIPPSTQLGYEDPGAKEHRSEIYHKLGTNVAEGEGSRVGSTGTVKDSREFAPRTVKGGSGNKTKERFRSKR